MAEKRFIKGLFKDTSHIDQPEGSWRYAKNAIFNDKKGSVSNEGGTSLAGHLGLNPTTGAQNDKVIGAIEVNDDKVVLFVTDVVNTTNPRSEVGIWENGVYTILLNPNVALNPEHDLNFKEEYPIEGTFKIDAQGNLIVYWTDDLNPPRALNVARQQRDSVTVNELYGMTNFNHIDILNLFPYAGSVPHIWVGDNWWQNPPNQEAVKEGGGLRTGVYYLALAYVDDDYVATNYLTVSNPIPIVDEFDWTKPTTKKDGMKEGSQTTKAITWRVSNLNTDYKYMRPVVIRNMGNATDAYKLNDVEINMNNAPTPFQEVTFSGIEGFSSAAVEEVIIDTTAYDTAKTINQLDGVLYVGNTTGSKDVGYQKYANNIKLNSVVKRIDNFDVFWATVDNFETGFGGFPVDKGNFVDASKSYRYVPNVFKYKGYTRDETYAFYIAFILNDGSMSYAYHIPGRTSSATPAELNSPGGNTITNDLHDVSPTYSKNFHWLDYSEAAGNRNMNYWHNATELYPTSDNFEIWDNNGYTGNDLKNTNVRHHHFPANWNDARRSIDGTNSTTEDSDGIVNLIVPYDGSFRVSHQSQGCETHFGNCPTSAQWRRPTFFQGPHTVTGNGADIHANCWSCICNNTPNGPYNNDGPDCFFTADQELDVTVDYHVFAHRQGNGGAAQPTWCRVRTNATNNGGVTTGAQDQISNYGGCGGGNNNDTDWNGGIITIHLMPGERAWVECNVEDCSDGGTPKARQARPSEIGNCDNSCRGGWPSSGTCRSFIKFDVLSTTAAADPDWYSDAKIDHDVQILGFELEDLMVPKSIADKVQGFRIYRAKRDHTNRTILGQAPLLPMSRYYDQIGICAEAYGAGTTAVETANEILKTLQDNPEFFWHVDPWPLQSGTELPYMLYDEETSADVEIEGYKNFSFHDFYLLNSKNSLSPATHIKPIYLIKNYAWNGPAIDQDKKPLTEIVINSGVKTVQEGWGWDVTNNCYPQSIDSAIFIGNHYINQEGGIFRLPRLLGQKAKTYLLGDSIFEGNDLGFGGKIFNEFGTSCMIFGLKDKHQLPAYWSLNSPSGDINFGGVNVASPTQWDDYGNNMLGHAAILVNPDHTGGPDGSGSYSWRSQYWMVNLGAFKTDLYKSIDSNALIWTGFEVIGTDFENFIFDDNTGNPTANGDYKTSTVEAEGIFGGDTFITRYGFPVALKPSNAGMDSNPRRALHYQIVESTDNINFRHVESAKSYYFPNTPARTVLKRIGQGNIIGRSL